MNSAKSSWREMASAIDVSHTTLPGFHPFRDTGAFSDWGISGIVQHIVIIRPLTV